MLKANSKLYYTIAGFVLIIFIGPVVLFLFGKAYPSGVFTNTFIVIRELTVFVLMLILFLIITKGERLGLSSIGIHNQSWLKSILWGVAGYLVCMALALTSIGILAHLGFAEVPTLSRYKEVSVSVLVLMFLRAGIVEGVFFRGFLIERLQIISSNKIIYFILPTLYFGFLHYTGGIRGVVVAFVIGLVLGLIYLKTKDLKACIIAHFLVDFISNVIVRSPS